MSALRNESRIAPRRRCMLSISSYAVISTMDLYRDFVTQGNVLAECHRGFNGDRVNSYCSLIPVLYQESGAGPISWNLKSIRRATLYPALIEMHNVSERTYATFRISEPRYIAVSSRERQAWISSIL